MSTKLSIQKTKIKQARAVLLKYVYDKLEINDLHGAIDALMDMRELDAQIKILQENK